MPIWPTDTWPTDIWSMDTWPMDIWPISAWGDIWPTDKMSHFNNSFIQFNNRISSIQRAVSDGNITKMWKESKEKLAKIVCWPNVPPCTYWPNVRWPSVRWPNGRWSNVPDSPGGQLPLVYWPLWLSQLTDHPGCLYTMITVLWSDPPPPPASDPFAHCHPPQLTHPVSTKQLTWLGSLAQSL